LQLSLGQVPASSVVTLVREAQPMSAGDERGIDPARNGNGTRFGADSGALSGLAEFVGAHLVYRGYRNSSIEGPAWAVLAALLIKASAGSALTYLVGQLIMNLLDR
jgi:hypothetical protein